MNLAKVMTFGAAALALSLAPAVAQSRKDPRQTNIEQRQAFFKLVGLYYGPLNAMNKGDIEYNAEVAAASAANLALMVQLDTSKLWLAGADRSYSEASLTLPKAFEDAGAIDKGLGDLASAVAALAPVAGNGLDPMKAAFAGVGGACKACHDSYRFKE